MRHLIRTFGVIGLVLGLLTSGAAWAQGKVDINQATPKELMSLKGVGEAKAKAIVKYRQMNGPFTSLDDLKAVPGIGDKILSDNKSAITMGKGKKGMKASTKKPKKEMKKAADKTQKEMKGSAEKAKKAMTDVKAKPKKAMDKK